MVGIRRSKDHVFFYDSTNGKLSFACLNFTAWCTLRNIKCLTAVSKCNCVYPAIQQKFFLENYTIIGQFVIMILLVHNSAAAYVLCIPGHRVFITGNEMMLLAIFILLCIFDSHAMNLSSRCSEIRFKNYGYITQDIMSVMKILFALLRDERIWR